MTYAGIDIGTNTILMVIADVEPNGSITVLQDQHTLPRLGEGVDQTGRISDGAIGRAEQVLRTFRRTLNQAGKPPIHAVGTSALRDASNSTDVVQRLSHALEGTVHVISGTDEATLTFRGTIGKRNGTHVVVDIGGGSTEIVQGENGMVQQRISVDVGSVRSTERWCKQRPMPPEQQPLMMAEIASALRNGSVEQFSSSASLTVVAGTGTALAMLDKGLTTFDPRKLDGHRLSRATVARLTNELLVKSHEELNHLPGIEPGRADILPAGASILLQAMDFLKIDEVTVSTRGLRYGALLFAAGIYT